MGIKGGVYTIETLPALELSSTERCIETSGRLRISGVNTLRTYTHRQTVHITTTTARSLKTDSTATGLPEDVENILKSCPNGKAPGVDCITYEHLKTAADIVSPLLSSLFTVMLRNAYIPDTLKQGIIITLHMGGQKRKDEP